MNDPERDPFFAARRSRRFVDWCLRHGRALWGCALVVALPASLRTAALYVHLKADLEQLLPTSAPSVVAIDELRSRMPGTQVLGVVVDSGSAANLPAAERLLDDLASRIRAYPPELVQEVRTTNAPERDFLERHAALYLSLDDLRAVRARLEAHRDYEVSRETGALLDDDAPPPPLDFDDILAKYPKHDDAGRFDDGRFSSRRLHLSLLLVRLGEFDTGRYHASELLRRVRDDVAALGGPERYAPGMRVGYAGDVAISVEETEALAADLSTSGALVVVAVIAAIVLYYRWAWAVVALLAPLLVSTVVTFAVASLPPFSVGALNSNTAFLGSIIVGNGINFGIVLLAAYVEARRGGCDVVEALARSVHGARRGTFAAALAAAAAYGSLVATDFRGFRQFGWIGGIGMLASWAAAFVLMPPLIQWIEADPSRAPRASRGPGAWVRVARAPIAGCVWVVALTVLATGLCAWKARSFDAGGIETDFSKLRRSDTWKSGEGYWGRRMEALLGTYLTPTVILTDSAEQARAIARAVRRECDRPPLSGFVASVRTIDDLLPPDQTAKQAEIAAIRGALTDRVRASLSPAQRATFDRWIGDSDRSPITAADLPSGLTLGLRERDGTIGREVLVYPRPSRALWQGDALRGLVDALRSAAATRTEAGDRAGRVAGSLPLSADIVSSVRHDGPRVTVLALAMVVASVFFASWDVRGVVLVLGSLLIAVVWLVGAVALLGIRVSFANFIAYPITFGIGVDYSVNVVSRILQSGPRSLDRVVRTTGGAVALCSATTVIGYSSLLMARNRGLFLFGLVAVLGEVCCLTAALVALPACLALVARLRGTAGPGASGERASAVPARPNRGAM